MHADDVEAVVEILAERAGADLLRQVAIGGGDDADVHPPGAALAADALHLAGLQEPEQDALHAGAHLAGFVEERRAAVAGLEQAHLVAERAGEAAADVTEELGLEQRIGHPGAVDDGERRPAPGALPVEQARHHVLADPGLARDEHLGVGARGARDLLSQLPAGGAAADEPDLVLTNGRHGASTRIGGEWVPAADGRTGLHLLISVAGLPFPSSRW